jgi:hypothetical protein
MVPSQIEWLTPITYQSPITTCQRHQSLMPLASGATKHENVPPISIRG